MSDFIGNILRKLIDEERLDPEVADTLLKKILEKIKKFKTF